MPKQNSLCFPCLEKVRTKFPVFPMPWPPCPGCTEFQQQWQKKDVQSCVLNHRTVLSSFCHQIINKTQTYISLNWPDQYYYGIPDCYCTHFFGMVICTRIGSEPVSGNVKEPLLWMCITYMRHQDYIYLCF